MKALIFLLLLAFSPLIHFAHENNSNVNEYGLIQFIENKGQIADRNNEPRPDVLFQIEGKPMFIREDGFTFVLTKSRELTAENQEKKKVIEEGEGSFREADWKFNREQRRKLESQQVSMTFLNTNGKIEVEKIEKSADYLNYYLPQCQNGVLGVFTYSQVNVLNLYRGISLNYYGNANGELKYDIRISPHANPNQIKCRWTGADQIAVQPDGRLLIKTQIRDVYESLPKVYQVINEDTIHIKTNYYVQSTGHEEFLVSYVLAEYNKKYELVIDPWVTNYGGEMDDLGLGVAADYESVVMVGKTSSTIAIHEDGFSETLAGEEDMFVAKFTSAGERVWGTYYGGVLEDYANGVEISVDKNIYVVGTTYSAAGIAHLGFQNEIGDTSVSDAVLIKFSETGERIWGTYYGGFYPEEGGGIELSDNGEFVFISGLTMSAEQIASDDGFQTTLGGGSDAFLVKFSEDGEREWATYYGGYSGEYGHDVGIDRESNVYLCGITTSPVGISTPLSYQEFSSGASDAFLVKFDTDGNRLWGTYYGGVDDDIAFEVCSDTMNNVYIAGSTRSEDNIAYEGNQMELNLGLMVPPFRDAFLAKFNPTGERLWATYIGGSEEDYGLSIDVDLESNNSVVSGDTYSIDFSVSSCALQKEKIGAENAFVTQFLPSGEMYCSSYFGVQHEEDNVSVFGGCNIYIVGTSPVGVATDDAHQELFGGEFDGYLAQIYKNSCGLELLEIELTETKEDVSNCMDCNGEFTVHVSTVGCTGNVSYINYSWSTGFVFNTLDTTSTITGLCPGEYFVIVELDCGLSDTLVFEIGNALNIPTADFIASNFCEGETVNFTNLSSTEFGSIISYSWSIDDVEISTDESFEYVFESPGVYYVSLLVMNSFGCTDSVNYEIRIHPNQETFKEVYVCPNSLVTFIDGYEIIATNDTSYSVLLSSVFGCDSVVTSVIYILPESYGTDTIFVDYNTWVTFPDGDNGLIEANYLDTSIIKSSAGCDSIVYSTYIINDFTFNPPNIFTPNSDNVNNMFFFPQMNVLTFECVIVNRWGIEVARFNTVDDKWDGTSSNSGTMCPDGVYFCIYKGTFINDEPFQGQGSIQLLR